MLRWLERDGKMVLQEWIVSKVSNDLCGYVDVPTVKEPRKVRELWAGVHPNDPTKVVAWANRHSPFERGNVLEWFLVREVLPCNHKLDNQACPTCGEIAPPRDII